MRRFNFGFGFWFGMAVVVIFGVVIYYMFYQDAKQKNYLATAPTHDIALSCTTDMATVFHIHPVLKIVIDRVDQVIPADTGITAGCMHPIHTHDATGTIHVESPVARDFTLGDFFAVWGKPFSSTTLMDKTVSGMAKLTVIVNGVQVNTFENTILRDKDQIQVTYISK